MLSLCLCLCLCLEPPSVKKMNKEVEEEKIGEKGEDNQRDKVETKADINEEKNLRRKRNGSLWDNECLH